MEKNKINEKKNKILKKAITFLFGLIIVLIFIWITLSDFINDKAGNIDIRDLIGNEYSGGESITVRENLILRGAIDAYVQAIYSGDYDEAYSYILPKYREIVSKEVFINKMEEIGCKNFVIESIEITQETEKMFLFDITIKNDNRLQILLILDDERYHIIPEPFLEYNQVDESITKKGVTYTLKGYEVDLERCIFDMNITNKKNEEVKITEVKMKNQAGTPYKSMNGELTLQPNETKDISFIIETHLDFPTTLEVLRNDDEKIRVYTFELE